MSDFHSCDRQDRLKRLCRLTALSMVGAWGFMMGAKADELAPTFDLWPLFYYEAGDRGRVEAAWPFFERCRDGRRRDTVLRPFWHSRVDPERDFAWSSILWPFIYRRRREGPRRDAAFLLMSSHTTDQTPGAPVRSAFTLFPFVYRTVRRDTGKAFAFWPFWGTIHKRFGYDRIQFVLWPAYTKMVDEVEGGTRVTWNVLWPIFSFSRGPGGASGWKFWPLYGRRRRAGRYDKRFLLWPFYIAVDADLGEGGVYHARMYGPFYGWEHSKKADAKTWLWPFISHTVNHAERSNTWSYFWPLLGRRRGPKEDVDKWLPLYRRKVNRERGTKDLVVLYPFYWDSALSSEDYTHRSWWIAPVFHHVRERWPARGETAEYTQVWPLFRYERRWRSDDASRPEVRVSFFSLWPYRDVSHVERSYGPFLLFVGGYRRKPNGDKLMHLLWRVVRYWRSGDGWFVQVWPVAAAGRARGRSRFALLQGLFEWRRGPSGSRLRLLYLPAFRISKASDAKRS